MKSSLALVYFLIFLQTSWGQEESTLEFHQKILYISDISQLQKEAQKELKTYQITGDKNHLLRYKLILTFISGKRGKTNKRLHQLIWLENHSGKDEELKFLAGYHLAYLLYYAGTPKIASYYTKKILPLSIKTKILYPETLSLLASTYYAQKKYKKARKYFWLCYVHQTKVGSSKEVLSLQLNNLGLCEGKLGNLPKSKAYFKKALSLIRNNRHSDNDDLYYLVSGNLGSCLNEMGDYQAAKPLLENEIAYFIHKKETNNPIVSPLRELLEIYYNENNDAAQRKIIHQLLNSAYFKESKKEFPVYTELISLHYKKKHDKEKTEYFSRLLIQKIKAFEVENSRLMQETTDILFEEKINFLNDHIKTQKLLYNQTKVKQNLYLIFFLIVIIFSVIGMYFIRLLYLNRQKLTLKDNQLKEEKIIALALSLSIKSETEKAFLDKLSEIKRKKEADTTKVLRELQLIVNNILSIDKKIFHETTDLNTYDERFKARLKELHPNLSNYDLQMCSYFRLRLTSKQIAVAFDTSDGAIRVHKNKIKHKLNLTGDISLEDYLTGIEN